MTAPKFTPGKWFATRHSHLDHLVARLNSVWSVYADKPAEHDAAADAHLIAAAPELYEALAKAMSWIDNWSPSFIYDGEWPEDAAAIRAALAKARGESNG